MKAGEIRAVATSYRNLFPESWVVKGSEWIRSQDDWVQFVTFNASRFDNSYVPRTALDYLKMPGTATAPLLLQELKLPNGAQRWVRLNENANLVFDEMAKQFKPSILRSIDIKEIKETLMRDLKYWPNVYVLCVLAVEGGDMRGAETYVNTFDCITSEKPYPWVTQRREELLGLIQLLKKSPAHVDTRLAGINAEKCKQLKLR